MTTADLIYIFVSSTLAGIVVTLIINRRRP
jgi:hypothetical protein